MLSHALNENLKRKKTKQTIKNLGPCPLTQSTYNQMDTTTFKYIITSGINCYK